MDIDDAMDLARAGDDEVELALCAEVKRLRAERDALKSQLYNSCEYERHDPEGCTCPLGYRLTEVEAERDVLRARTEKLETALRHIQNNLCLNPAKDEFYLRHTFRLYEIDAALRGEE